MSRTALNALHQVHTATNDVLEGYETMLKRAEPEIVGVISDLTALHKRHATAQSRRLRELGQDDDDDSSLQGTINSVAVTMRDWVTGLDKGSLDAVQRGEKALQDIYDDAMTDWSSAEDQQTSTLLDEQFHEIGAKIATLEQI